MKKDSPPIKKNEQLIVTIEDYAANGSGIAKPGGFVLFVPGALKGERVLVHVLKCLKHMGYAKLLEIITPSPSRIIPRCPVSDRCGGCDLWHMDYAAELEFKYQKVLTNLRRRGITAPLLRPIPADSITAYRNKAQFPIRSENGVAQAGFYAKHSHRIIPANNCLTLPPVFNDICNSFLEFINHHKIPAYDEQTHKGVVRHLYLRCTKNSDQIIVCIVINTPKFPHIDRLIQLLIGKYEGISTVCINYNNKISNVVLGERTETVYGEGHITDRLCGRKFYITPHCFYQINHNQTGKLYRLIGEYAAVQEGEIVLDLYCGIGAIGLAIGCGAGQLIGIEQVEEAVIAARKNALLNKIDNALFYTADAADTQQLVGGSPDIIIVDPPRKGLCSKTLGYICRLAPKRLIYVSCDSATLARDLKILQDDGDFKVREITPVDMFPRTAHVECVCLLARE